MSLETGDVVKSCQNKNGAYFWQPFRSVPLVTFLANLLLSVLPNLSISFEINTFQYLYHKKQDDLAPNK